MFTFINRGCCNSKTLKETQNIRTTSALLQKTKANMLNVSSKSITA